MLALHIPALSQWTSGDVTAAATVGTLLVALFAAIIGLYQVRQARRLRAEEAAPYIVVDIAPIRYARTLLALTVENTGATIARNVTLTFSPKLEQAMDTVGYPINDWVAVKDGIKTMTPGRRVTAIFDESPVRFKANLALQYDVRIEYENGKGDKQPTVTYTIDLRPIFGAMQVHEKTTHDLVREAAELNDKLATIMRDALPVELVTDDG